MAFTVSEFRDLIQLLEQHPTWWAELRCWVLTEELLALPQTVVGTPALPVVAGFWVTPDAQEPARAFRVWQVTAGRVTPSGVAPRG